MSDWRPDVLVRDSTELTACVAAERAGIPHVVFQVAAPVPWYIRAMSAPLNRLLASVGLRTALAADILYAISCSIHARSVCGIPTYPCHPRCIPFAIQVSANRAVKPSWVGRGIGRRPTVYATLGTVMNDRTDLLWAILNGLRGEPIDLILTVGRNGSPHDFGEQPPNVHIERYIPQNMLLPLCVLVVTHGGSGTMMDALSFGLPMVMIPISADQPVNAQLCSGLGVARVVTPWGAQRQSWRRTSVTPRRRSCGTRAYRESAQRLRNEMEALPGLEYPVSLLETLAAKRTPLVAHPHTN